MIKHLLTFTQELSTAAPARREANLKAFLVESGQGSGTFMLPTGLEMGPGRCEEEHAKQGSVALGEGSLETCTPTGLPTLPPNQVTQGPPTAF